MDWLSELAGVRCRAVAAAAAIAAVAAADPAGAAHPVTATIPPVNGLASTPYMGWNTYYGVGTHYDEATVESVADALVSRGLRDAGYRYLWLDGGWWSGTRDQSGAITVDPQRWPDGMAAVAS
jgi:alpha-galactosidase